MKEGMCTECGEWTDTEWPCCDAGVFCEGEVVFSEEITEGNDNE